MMRPEVMARLFDRKGQRPKKSPEVSSYIPKLDRVEALAQALLADSQKNEALRERLLFFAGKTKDTGEEFSTRKDTKYGEWVDVIVNGDPTTVAVRIGVGKSEDPSFYITSRLAIPDTIVFRHKPLRDIRDEEALGAILTSFIRSELLPGEKLDNHSGVSASKLKR